MKVNEVSLANTLSLNLTIDWDALIVSIIPPPFNDETRIDTCHVLKMVYSYFVSLIYVFYFLS